jgi:hypothetical protein
MRMLGIDIVGLLFFSSFFPLYIYVADQFTLRIIIYYQFLSLLKFIEKNDIKLLLGLPILLNSDL